MKHQSKFKPNGRITHRIWILNTLIVSIQHKYSSVADRIYTERKTTWGGKSCLMQMNCSNCLLSKRSWYLSPGHSSVQLHVSSEWHFFFFGLLSTFGPALENEIMENTLFFWRVDFLTAYRCPWSGACTDHCTTLVLYLMSHLSEVRKCLSVSENGSRRCPSLNTEKGLNIQFK